jgi:alanyl-tRNA synthetase
MTSFDLRKKFFDFFKDQGHTLVPSSSLIPAQDPTLLFTNAGMNQFKDLFLGKEKRTYTRAVSIQKCIRAGGKHNDLENVGFTKRHLTFFEMMGNFSFGDYFKKEAIIFAWDFLTKAIKLEAKKLTVTVHYKDDEAYAIWRDVIGVPEHRIFRLGDKDNFWQMGDTGPCGPCTEIYVDRGTTYDCGSKDCNPEDGCERFLEVWNLVFMQYDRLPDGTDKPLAHTGVDTGMGLERLCAIMQEKDSVFETDLFAPLLTRIEELTSITYATANPETQAAFRVLADHIRSTCFAIADGGTPSNEGRGYVIRKIIRRATLFAQKLGRETLFPEIAPTLIDYMSPLYPELKTQEKQIVALLHAEVEKFQKTFLNGQQMLEKYFAQAGSKKVLSGEHAFKLYDTYGFPLELTKVIAHEKGFTVDSVGFEREMELQRERSGKKVADAHCDLEVSLTTDFTGYEVHYNTAHIVGLIEDTQSVSHVEPGAHVYVITDVSPFFVECGGQISDQGSISLGDARAPLRGLKKFGTAIGAFIEAPVGLKVGDTVHLEVDSAIRINTMKNHTATHLLQAALIELLGKQVRQSGSVVTPDYLRFDFSYHENLTPEQIKIVENRVNAKIQENIPVDVHYTTLKEATSQGVIAIFGEKYQPEQVRVITVPGFSAELCGGTHVTATGDIGPFKITEISALSAGNRRIVAVTGPAAVELFQDMFSTLKTLGTEFKVPVEQVGDAVKKQKEQLRAALATVKELRKSWLKSQIDTWTADLEQIGTLPYLSLPLEQVQPDELKDIAALLVAKRPALYILVAQDKERSPFYITVAPSISSQIDLKKLAAWLKEQGIQGGGSGTSLQGSITSDFGRFDEKIKSWLKEHIN